MDVDEEKKRKRDDLEPSLATRAAKRRSTRLVRNSNTHSSSGPTREDDVALSSPLSSPSSTPDDTSDHSDGRRSASLTRHRDSEEPVADKSLHQDRDLASLVDFGQLSPKPTCAVCGTLKAQQRKPAITAATGVSGLSIADDIAETMDNIRVIRGMHRVDRVDANDFIRKILDKMEAIPPTPVFPPPSENSWSQIVQIARQNGLDDEVDWLRGRMSDWISYLLKIPFVSPDHLTVSIVALRRLLATLGPWFVTKYDKAAEDTMLKWQRNLVRQGTSKDDYVQALRVLLDLSDMGAITYDEMDDLELRWKEAYRRGPLTEDKEPT